jgi:SNF2 family DNA or RNA helicase
VSDAVPAAQVDWRAVLGPKRDFPYDAWVEGRFIYYRPPRNLREWARLELGGRKAGAKYPPQTRGHLPLLVNVVEKIRHHHPEAQLAPELHYLVDEWRRDRRIAPLDKVPPTFEKLYPFQREAVAQMTTSNYRGTFAVLSPGLGKTPISIVAGSALSERGRPNLVLAPLPLLRNWVDEIRRWSPGAVVIRLHGEEPQEYLEEHADSGELWLVCNYDTVRARSEVERGDDGKIKSARGPFHDVRWNVLVLDESVLLKNRASLRSQVVKHLAKKAAHVWPLTGSPITRDTSDAWMQLHTVEPDYFPSFWRFAKEFCYVEEDEWSTSIVGSRPDKTLRQEYPELVFVRNQDEVLPDLPELLFQDIPVELTPRQRKAHDDVTDKWLHKLESSEQVDARVSVTAVVAMITRLQQITGNLANLGPEWPDESAKADVLLELLKDGAVHFPLLVWTHWVPGADALAERLRSLSATEDSPFSERRTALVHGGVKGGDDIIQQYKDGHLDVLVLSQGVGKYGHTLTNTQTVVYHDKSYASDAYFQSLHRVRRIGLDHPVRVISLRAINSADQIVEENLAGKLPSMASSTGADVSRLLRGIGEEYVYVPPPHPSLD